MISFHFKTTLFCIIYLFVIYSEAFTQAKSRPRTLSPSCIVHKEKTRRPIRIRSQCKIVSTVGQGTPRDSAMPMVRLVGNAEKQPLQGGMQVNSETTAGLPTSAVEALHVTRNKSIALKTYNQSNIEQLVLCTVRVRQEDQTTRSRFFVVLGDSQALLGMPDIELLGILKITCDVVEGQQTGRKFYSQTVKPSCTLSHKAKKDWEIRSDNADVINTNPKHARSFQVQHRQRSIQKGKLGNNLKNS